MMNIAYLLGSLNRGGTETLILDTLKNTKEENINVSGIYRRDGQLSGDFRNIGVKLIKLRPGYKFDLFYVIKLRRLFNNENIHIVHAQQPIDALYAYIASKGLNTKVILSLHGFDFSLRKLTKKFIQFVMRRVDLVIFVSNTQRDYYIDKYHFQKEKTRVLYNGICFNKFYNIQPISIRKEFGVSENDILLGSVGNFNVGRDQMTICRFLNRLNQQNISFTFIFIGSKSETIPHYWNDCQDYCSKNGLGSKVIFAGSRSDIPNFLNQLDAFIYSTDHDSFGIAVIEAMYMGVPVFINNWKVFEEITGQGRHGNFYRTKDENDLLNKFMPFLANRKIFDEKAKLDSQWVKEQYSIQNHIKNLLEVYRSVLTN